MTCKYFGEHPVGFCSASDFPYVPSLREMELYCMGNCHTCMICRERHNTCE